MCRAQWPLASLAGGMSRLRTGLDEESLRRIQSRSPELGARGARRLGARTSRRRSLPSHLRNRRRHGAAAVRGLDGPRARRTGPGGWRRKSTGGSLSGTLGLRHSTRAAGRSPRGHRTADVRSSTRHYGAAGRGRAGIRRPDVPASLRRGGTTARLRPDEHVGSALGARAAACTGLALAAFHPAPRRPARRTARAVRTTARAAARPAAHRDPGIAAARRHRTGPVS